ncbi:MAG TPA: rod shape-determining protein MreC [Gaiellaceae bacterium]|nr:rod shape-determining protein MreC [Gaiellaceae bacterium]
MPRNRTVRLAVLGSSVQRAAPSGYPSSRSSAVKRRIVVGLLVLASLVLITVSFRSSALDGLQGTGATVLRPFEIAADRVTRPFADTIGWFRGLADAKSENRKLRAQVAELQSQLILDEGAIQENVQLRKALDYHGPPSVAEFTPVNAAVLANPQNAIDQSVTISAGTSQGIVVGSVVVEPTGGSDGVGALVGTVDRAFSNVARVTLLTDAESAVTATDLTNTGVVGAIRRGSGSSDVLILDRVPKQAVVRRDDTIITAGTLGEGPLRSKFPRGIPIGTVSSQSLSDASLFQNIQVKPLVDFSSLRSVVVLVPPKQP